MNAGFSQTTPNVELVGQVIDAINKEPLIGATVRIPETSIGTYTDLDGNFQFSYQPDTLPDTVRLLVTYVGYNDRLIVIDMVAANTPIVITLKESVQQLDEIVAIGYGSQFKSELNYSLSSVKSKTIEDQPVTSFDQALAGKVAGLDISQDNGAPGGASTVTIRGNNSINHGNSPLYVIDGVPISNSAADSYNQGQALSERFDNYTINPLSSLNPQDIESIEILKDAAATAIYGSRGSNGVILITTKKGSSTATEISVGAYGGFQQVIRKIDVMDAYEFATFFKRSRDNAWVALNPLTNSASDPNEFRNGPQYKIPSYLTPYLEGGDDLINTDWQDEIFQTAAIQNYHLSLRGGTEKSKYFVSANYFDQQGVIINSGIRKHSARLNLETVLTDKIKFGINLNPSYNEHNIVQTERNWWKEGVVITALMYHPNLAPYDAQGNPLRGEMLYTQTSGAADVARIENPVALAQQVQNTLNHTRFLGNTYFEFQIIKDLIFKTNVGGDVSIMDRFYYRPKFLNHYTELAPTTNMNISWVQNSGSFNWLAENTLDYKRTFNDHRFTFLLGYTVQKEHNERTYAHGTNFPNDDRITLNAAEVTRSVSSEREWSLLSYLSRITYNYKGKYYLTASLRRDGSSRFGKNTKWGIFPSASAGWILSDEPFYHSGSFLNYVKLRGSFGITGNTQIPYYGGLAILGEYNYILDDEIVPGFAPRTSPNPDLTWESTQTTDLGIDLEFMQGQYTLTSDVYYSKTNDLLLNVTLPPTGGYSNTLQNTGEVENYGLEVTLGSNYEIGKVKIKSAANFSINRNRVLKLGPGQQSISFNSGLGDPAFIVRVGEPIGSFYGYNVLGIFTSQEQFAGTPHLENENQGVGDFIYEDTDNDGDVDRNDRVILGNAYPDFTVGFSSDITLKSWNLSFNWIGKFGMERLNSMHRYLGEGWGNALAVYGEPGAPGTIWGRGTKSNTRPSGWHVEDASFVRLRNITLAYRLPSSITLKYGFSQARLYFSAINPLTFTRYSGYNPEVSNNGRSVTFGEEFGNYPASKSYTLGVNLTFKK